MGIWKFQWQVLIVLMLKTTNMLGNMVLMGWFLVMVSVSLCVCVCVCMCECSVYWVDFVCDEIVVHAHTLCKVYICATRHVLHQVVVPKLGMVLVMSMRNIASAFMHK